jgi:hypothetical protein
MYPVRNVRVFGLLALILCVMAACGSPATPRPVVVVISGTETPLPERTAPPGVATPVWPTILPTQTAPAAPSTPAPKATAAAQTTTAAATAIPFYGPDTYPNNVNPLTGQEVDPAKLNRMPVAVKISNFPYVVRPQFGLGLADIVFEHLAEQGLTRFTAIFLQNDAAKAGSVRSARYIDTEIEPMFQALLVTSGSSFGTMDHLKANPWFSGANIWRLISESTHYNTCPPLCRETPDDSNTLFTSTDGARTSAGHAANQRMDLHGLAFTLAVPANGKPVTDIEESFSSAAHVSWRYNAGSARYDRWQDKDQDDQMVAHFDGLTKLPISAANVVLLNVNHQNNFVPEDFQQGGTCGLEIQLWLSGPARIYRDGQMFEGVWKRDQSTGMRLQLQDLSGQVIPLKPGNTWIGLVTLNAVSVLNNQTFTVTNKVPDTRSVCPVPPTETPTATPEGWVAPTETPKP